MRIFAGFLSVRMHVTLLGLCKISIFGAIFCFEICRSSLTCSALGQLNLNFGEKICRRISIPDHNTKISFDSVDAKLLSSSKDAGVRSWQIVTNLKNGSIFSFFCQKCLIFAEILTRHQLIERTHQRTVNEACAIVSRLQNILVKCAECSASLLGNGVVFCAQFELACRICSAPNRHVLAIAWRRRLVRSHGRHRLKRFVRGMLSTT
jgi:hypothetical protein